MLSFSRCNEIATMSNLPVKQLTHSQKLDLATLAALGVSAEKCVEHLRQQYEEDVPLSTVRGYLRRKGVREEIEVIRREWNKNLEKIPIANRSVQVRVLDEILNKQQTMCDGMVVAEKESLAAQLLNDARATVKQIAEISGTLSKEQQVVQDSRSQTNIITTFIGDANPEKKKAILSGLSSIVSRELVTRGLAEDSCGDVAGGVAAIPAGDISGQM